MYSAMLDKISKEVSAEQIMNHVAGVCQFHRIQASPGFRAAAEYCLSKLKQAGLISEIHSYPARGLNKNFTDLVPQEWKIEKAELSMVLANGQRERLGRFSDYPTSVIQRTAPTPPGGLKGPLVILDEAHKEVSYRGLDLAGSWILTDKRPELVQPWAKKFGALGIITDLMDEVPFYRPKYSLADAYQYHAFWALTEEEAITGFVLTPRQGLKIRELVAKGEEVILEASVLSSFYPGYLENVKATIEGESPEEILLIAHLCHPKPSANDNASGVAVLLETARLLNSLISKGQLAKPKRTISFLLVPEMTGSYAYLADPRFKEVNTLAALNLDMVGQSQEKSGGSLLLEAPPLAQAGFGIDLLRAVLEGAFSNLDNIAKTSKFPPFRYEVTPFSGGSDHYILSDPTIDIPCPMLIQWPDRYYHTSADTIDNLDPQMMERVAILAACYLYFLASGQEEEMVWLADRLLAHFKGDLALELSKLLDKRLSKDYLISYLNFQEKRILRDLEALSRFNLKADWRELVEKIIGLERERIQNYPGLLEEEALEKDSKYPLELELFVPKRLFKGPMSSRGFEQALKELSLEDQEAYQLALARHQEKTNAWQYPVYLCYWMDGQRDLETILKKVELETGIYDGDFALAYCLILQEMGFLVAL